jgi:hypothetical protein
LRKLDQPIHRTVDEPRETELDKTRAALLFDVTGGGERQYEQGSALERSGTWVDHVSSSSLTSTTVSSLNVWRETVKDGSNPSGSDAGSVEPAVKLTRSDLQFLLELLQQKDQFLSHLYPSM